VWGEEQVSSNSTRNMKGILDACGMLPKMTWG
jgi:hypothetical protein